MQNWKKINFQVIYYYEKADASFPKQKRIWRVSRATGQLIIWFIFFICYTCGGDGRSGCGCRSFDQKWFGSSKWSTKGSSAEWAKNAGRRRRSVFARRCTGSDGSRRCASCSHMSRMTGCRRHHVNRRDGNPGASTNGRRRGSSRVTASERRRSQRLLGFAGGRWALADATKRHVEHFLVKG